ncbi:hypothetical protein DFH09DRAFT_1312123 [Mycena vulgaris]|nr:hypothetical protein DFH09DRAFT_1312123 [Mycena vulgaris]
MMLRVVIAPALIVFFPAEQFLEECVSDAEPEAARNSPSRLMRWVLAAIYGSNGYNPASSSCMLAAVIFGAIHCSAWAAAFPPTAENGCGAYLDQVRGAFEAAHDLARTLLLYILSRVLPIVLPFTALRILSANDFIDVDWTGFIPYV